MSTQHKLEHKQQHVARLERSLALSKLKKRKADTRRKIQFGGLVIKANMDSHSKAIILGVLLDAAEQIERDPTVLTIYQQKGEAAFMGYGESRNVKHINYHRAAD